MIFTPLILPVSADEYRWRSPWAYYYYMPLRPLLLISSHSSSFKVNVRQLGCSMSLVTKLRNVIMLACAVAQDSAELGQNDLDNLLCFACTRRLRGMESYDISQTVAHKIHVLTDQTQDRQV